MKWELWKDNEGNEQYIIAHPVADSTRKKLSEKAKVIWSCDASSQYDAQCKILKYQGAWLSLLVLKVKRILEPSGYKQTYKDIGWE